MKEEICISYAWDKPNEERVSEPIVESIIKKLEDNSFSVLIDKRSLTYKDDISKFEERLASGDRIVIVINDRYLKSPHCMYELLKIEDNGNVYSRVFPIVLTDANIYNPTNVINYVTYWEKQVEELDAKIKGLNRVVSTSPLIEDLDIYNKIRCLIPSILKLLQRMNTLTPEIHKQTDFSGLIKALRGDRIEIDESINEEGNDFKKKILEVKTLYENAGKLIRSELVNQNIKEGELLSKFNHWHEQCKEQTFLIGIMAMVKSGKSSFLNALMGNEFLPMSNIPETALPIRIIHTGENEGRLEDIKGKSISGAKSIIEYLKEQNNLKREKGSKKIQEYKLYSNLIVIEEKDMAGIRFEIVDTPGFGEALEEIIVGKNLEQSNEEMLEKLSVIIYLLDYTKLKTDAEKEILTKLSTIRPDLLEKIQERLFFIVNKIDEEDRNSLSSDETTAYVYSKVLNKIPKLKRDQIFVLSARNALLSRLILLGNATTEARKDFGKGAFGINISKANENEYKTAAKELLLSSHIVEVEGRIFKFLYAHRGKILIDTLTENLRRILTEFKNKYITAARGTLNTKMEDILVLEERIEDAKKKQKNIQREAERFEIEIKKWIDIVFNEFEKKVLDYIDSAFNEEKAEQKAIWFKTGVPTWVKNLQKKLSFFETSIKGKSKEEILEILENLNNDISEPLYFEFSNFRENLENKLYDKQTQLLGGLEISINTLSREFEATLNKVLNVNLEPIELKLDSVFDLEKTLGQINNVMDRYIETKEKVQQVKKSHTYYDPEKWCGLFGGNRTRVTWESKLVITFNIKKSTIELHWKNMIESMNQHAKEIANHFIENHIQAQIQNARKKFDDYSNEYLIVINTEKSKLSEGGKEYIEIRLAQLSELESEVGNLFTLINSAN